MKMRPSLVISDESAETVERLREGSAGCEEVTVMLSKASQLLKVESLDAFYTSVMGAERWGALPISHCAQVLRTTADDRGKGYPPYVIAGGLFDLADPRDPYFQLPVIVNTVLDAVDSFNATNVSTIKKIGFWSEDLCVPRINPVEAGKILKSLYEAHYNQDQE